MGSYLCFLLLFSGLWTLSLCVTRQLYLVNVNKNWTEAQKYCRQNYTDLATIENQKEMNVLIALINQTSSRYQIGLRQTVPPGNTKTWVWSDASNHRTGTGIRESQATVRVKTVCNYGITTSGMMFTAVTQIHLSATKS
ncbi:E-selectin-like [Hoplias malabaricus]|uniref:E-selectin-like n=1 Tax=Hoplias malabaricus TaxID=27720 RepID=UPI0034634DE5